MSLVPYSSRDNREIVLRHNDAIVVRDPQTQKLSLRGASGTSFSECPTCHRPLRSVSPERQSSPHRSTPFISPEYFRMLQAAYSISDNPPSSPVRRLVQPAFPTPSIASSTGGSVAEAEFVTSSPAPQTGHGIKKEAFSPNYFKSFFIEEKELGRGGKGVVLLVKHQLDGVSLGQFACKRVPVGDDHAWLEKVLIEVQLLQGLSHPNLVSYRHVWLEDAQLNRFGPSVPCAYILQQYCNSGDLHQYIVGPPPTPKSPREQLREQQRRRSRGQSEHIDPRNSRPMLQRKLSFEEIYSYFKDITSGLAHLHNANYIHRDLKPSNCLLHKDGNELRCLISDFGEVQAENVVRKSTGSTGTISYCAPEVLRKNEFGSYGNFTTKSDIFSLGMILYFMCFGRLPYASANSVQEEFEDIDLLRAEISSWSGFHDERRERPELPNQLYEFLKRLLATNPSERPSANEILTAIQTEKGLEAPSRSRSSNSGSLAGRIIQSLDGPMPSGTRINEPTKRVLSPTHLTDSTPSPEHEDGPSSQLILENRSHVRQSRSRSRRESIIPKPNISTPLLMPPPSTLLSTVIHRVEVFWHYTSTWTIQNQQFLNMLLRLAIFLAKFLSLTKPCAPLAMKEVVLWPLVVLAATEAVMGNRIGWAGTGGVSLGSCVYAGGGHEVGWGDL